MPTTVRPWLQPPVERERHVARTQLRTRATTSTETSKLVAPAYAAHFRFSPFSASNPSSLLGYSNPERTLSRKRPPRWRKVFTAMRMPLAFGFPLFSARGNPRAAKPETRKATHPGAHPLLSGSLCGAEPGLPRVPRDNRAPACVERPFERERPVCRRVSSPFLSRERHVSRTFSASPTARDRPPAAH